MCPIDTLEARNFRASSILSGQQVRRIDRCSRDGLSQQVLQGSQLIVNVNRVTNDERFGGTFAMNRLALAQQACDECGPTGLVGGTAASTGVAVEVFVEQDKVAPIRIGRVSSVLTVTRTASGGIGQEEARETA